MTVSEVIALLNLLAVVIFGVINITKKQPLPGEVNRSQSAQYVRYCAHFLKRFCRFVCLLSEWELKQTTNYLKRFRQTLWP